MNDFKMNLPSDVLFILEKIRENGYSAHVVGGSVRDSLIGRELGDFDITTSATPEVTKEIFKEHKTVDTGIKHGTVTLVLCGIPYEITTYRVDGDYKDSRHPERVSFTADLREDLARRDFTVNAMAYSDVDGLVDPFSGRTDTERKIIRAVGDPYVRFSEDALRILRALRFASVLGFEIEERTAQAVKDLSSSLVNISKERIWTELKKLIMGQNACFVLETYASVFEVVLSGLNIRCMPKKEDFDGADFYTRLACLFLLNCADPASDSERILTELKTDKLTRTHTFSVLSSYNTASFSDTRAALVTLMENGKEITEGVLSLGILTGKFSHEDEKALSAALASGIPYRISALDVRGGDLAALGIKGECVGQTLELLLHAVVDGKVENEKNALIRYIGK